MLQPPRFSSFLLIPALALVATVSAPFASAASAGAGPQPDAVEVRRGSALGHLIEAGVVAPSKGEFETTDSFAKRAAYKPQWQIYRVRVPEEDIQSRTYDADEGAWRIAFGILGGRLPAASIRGTNRETGARVDLKGPAFVLERYDGRRLPRPTAAVPGPAGGTDERPVVAYAVGLSMTNPWQSETLRNLTLMLGRSEATVSFPMPAAEARRLRKERLGLELFFEVDFAVANVWSTTWVSGNRPVEVREYLPVHVLGVALRDGRREESLGYTEVDDSKWPTGKRP